jgi:hypothetical protein
MIGSFLPARRNPSPILNPNSAKLSAKSAIRAAMSAMTECSKSDTHPVKESKREIEIEKDIPMPRHSPNVMAIPTTLPLVPNPIAPNVTTVAPKAARVKVLRVPKRGAR